MAEGSGARWRDALGVRRDKQAYAYLMVGVVVACILTAGRVPKGAQRIARPMAVGNDVHLQGAPRELKGAHHFARDMVEGSGVSSMVGEYVLRVFMVAQTSV